MANMTLFIPDDLKRRMEKHKDVRWSNAVRTIIESKLDDLEITNELARGSTLTEEDVEFLTNKVNADIRRHVKTLMK